MAQPSRHCVDAAIAFANGPEHEGEGYTLRIVLKNREIIEGAFVPVEGQHPDVLYLRKEQGLKQPVDTFIDKHEIASASVIW